MGWLGDSREVVNLKIELACEQARYNEVEQARSFYADAFLELQKKWNAFIGLRGHQEFWKDTVNKCIEMGQADSAVAIADKALARLKELQAEAKTKVEEDE